MRGSLTTTCRFEEGIMVMMCRKSCCPEINFAPDKRRAMISADVVKDDVVLSGDTVGIRFRAEQLQQLANELARNGYLPEEGHDG